MPETRECPMCGGTMKIKETRSVLQVPGNPRAITRTTNEWVCPDCDYFEEAEEESM
jgi:rubredoxin